MSNVIIFYDISSILPDQTWSPNTWRIRYSLNYKGLPYTTVWVDYPDIAAVCKKIGAAPTSTRDGSPLYTLPVIHDPSTGAVISDGPAIAEYLDATYPSTPKLFPQGTRALQYACIHAFSTALGAFRIFTIPAAHQVLNPVSQKFYRSTREPRFGRKLEDIAPTGQQREEAWKKANESFGIIDTWLTKGGGTYLMGDTIGFADITLISWLQYTKKVFGESSEEWKDIKGWHGGRWDRLLKASEEALQIFPAS